MLVLLAFALATVRRERVAVGTDADIATFEAADAKSDLCDEMLFVTYKGKWQGRTVNTAEGTWRLDPGEWESATIVTKKAKSDEGECTRTYTAVCAEGVIQVKKTCEDSCTGADECVETRSLTGLLKSKGTDLKVGSDGEYALEVYDPEWQNQHLYDPETKQWGQPDTEFGTLTRDTRVSWATSKSAGGVRLEKIPWMGQSWKAPTGCYCCKHSYNFLSNPFANANGAARQAWTTNHGTEECMLAWTELPEDTLWDFMPRILAMLVDRLTLTVGSHATCSATCASVSKEFRMHKHSFMKYSESYY